MDEMAHEDSMRYVFDRCGRYGDPKNLADADVFRLARSSGDWSAVAEGLESAIERLRADCVGINWFEEEAHRGGLKNNLIVSLEGASRVLKSGSEKEDFVVALSRLVHATKAAILKASGPHPPAYNGSGD